MIADTSYAIEASRVQQLELIESITRVPGSADFIDGVVYLRGKVVPVVNLRRRLGLQRIPIDLSARLIIVRHDSRVVGLTVDSAREFLTFPEASLQPPPDNVLGSRSDCLAGVIALEARMIFILDIPCLLEDQQQSLKAASPTLPSQHKGDSHGPF